MSKSIITMIGGIGDILLNFSGLENISDLFSNKIECHIFTHYDDMPNLLTQFKFEQQFYFYKTQEEFQKLLPELIKLTNSPEYIGDVDVYNTTIFPLINNNYNKEFFELKSKKYVVIHPFGSTYSNEFLQNKRNVISKNLSKDLVASICEYLTKINITPVLVGSPKEDDYLLNMTAHMDAEIQILTSDNIWESFALVDNSLFVVAADSAIKSYSAITKKPTIVYIGDYEDKIRDEKFILPYEKEWNQFKVIRFKDFGPSTLFQTKEILDGWT